MGCQNHSRCHRPRSQRAGCRCAGETEEAQEGEIADALDRERYERGEGKKGYRNGYRPGKVKTVETG